MLLRGKMGSIVRTEVFITIDTEFSIGGAFTYPNRYVPLGEEVVRCEVNGREEGLGFMLDTFGEFGIKATFFVEALQTAYFGDVPMGRLVDRIAKAGHDLQLHLHPCWLHFRKRGWKTGKERPNDSCMGRTDAELDEMLEIGYYAFDRWKQPRPIALRTGGFETDLAVYRAMERAGMRFASNIALGMREPAESELQLTGGRAQVGKIVELPVLSYRSPVILGRRKRQMRSVSITGASWPETRSLMWEARKTGTTPVVLLTHAFEFIKRRDFRFAELRPNRLNQHRLRQLLQFLKDNPDDFVPTTFRDYAEKPEQTATPRQPALSVPMSLAVIRAVGNALNDRVWRM
jgi:hypothetical protein